AAFTADVYVPLSSGKWGIKYESSNSLETQEIIVKRPITWTLYTFIPTQTNNLWGLALIYQVENAIDASRKNGLSPMVSYQSQILQSVELVGYFSYTPETYREAESAGVNSLASVTIGVAADWQFTQALKLSPRIQYIRGKTLEADNILSVDTHRLSMVETTAQLAYYF
ncbi:MAG: hypothetical protein HRU19_28555, partial [Pseudobacteriovorax sp.]|nr:hypothetical protein [Pseudobacteriovorax sp.]